MAETRYKNTSRRSIVRHKQATFEQRTADLVACHGLAHALPVGRRCQYTRCDRDEPDTDLGSIEMKLVHALVTDYTCTYPRMFRYRAVQGLFFGQIN